MYCLPVRLLVGIVMLMLPQYAHSSHFRGGIFMVRPRPGGGANEMEVFYHISWRRSSGAGGNCDATTISSSTSVAGEGSLVCASGCSATIGTLSYQCTDFSASEDWSFGQNALYYTFPASTAVSVGFTGSCCWVSPFSSSWNLLTTFSTAVRSDIGVINSTPRAATSPVVRLQVGCTHEFRIPVSDPDGDVVKCRWGTGTECYDVCGGFPGATIDSDTCTISYTANQGTGFKVAVVAIEDFQTASSSTPFSTVVLQFLVFVFTVAESCSSSPYFVSPPTLKSGVCVAVAPGATFTTQIVASNNASSSASISDIATISPSGSAKTSVVNIGSNMYYINVTWTPSASQQGQTHVLCYTAVSSTGTNSEQFCIRIDAGILPPQPNTSTLSPANNDVISGQTWSLNFTKDIQRPSVSSYIKFHSATNDAVVFSIDPSSSAEVDFVSSMLTITPNFTFPELQSFYITFENGVVNSLEGCEAGNEPVTDKTFWTFQTPSASEPVITSSIYPSSEFDYYYNSSVELVCHSAGKPIPAVNWYRNGVLLSTGSNGISITQSINGQNVTSRLAISSLTTIVEGQYMCNGTNTLINGSVSTDVELFSITIQGILAINMTGVAVSSTAIHLTWDVPPVPSIIIQYFIVMCNELETAREWSFFAVETHANIISLHPYYSYSCRVGVVGNDTYRFNTPITVTTHEAAPNAAPVNTSGYSINSTAVNIQWATPPLEDHNGIIREYRVLITNLNTGENQTTAFASNSSGIIGSLTPSFEYRFSVTAFTVAEGPYSSSITITMPEDVPSGYPQSVMGNSTSPTGIYISWSPPLDNEQNGDIVQYIINVTHTDTLATVQYFTNNRTYKYITGLDPYTTYVCVVAAETAVGVGPFSNQFLLQTQEDAPNSAPLNANGTSLGSTSIFLTWEPPLINDHNGVIREYRVNVTQQTAQFFDQLVTNETQIIIEDLKPYRVYHCYISAVTVDEGPYTTAVTVLTDEAAPSSPPLSVSVSVVNSTSITMAWSPPPTPDHNGILQSYSIIVTANGDIHDDEFTFTTQGTTFNTSVLNPYTTYTIQVAAFTVDTGPYTTGYNITTHQDVPSGPPQNITGSIISSTKLEISWNPPVLALQNGPIKSYNITVYELDTNTTTQEHEDTLNNTIILVNLHPNYDYLISVAAYTVGLGPFTDIQLTTLEDIPSAPPENIQVTDITSTTALLLWMEPDLEDQNGVIKHYRVIVIGPDNSQQTHTSANLSIQLTNLHPHYLYQYTIQAVTIGNGPSASISFTTLEDVPASAPTNLTTSFITSTGVLLSWYPLPPVDHNGIILGYTVTLTESDTSNQWNLTSNTTSLHVLALLSPHTTYQFTVAAQTSIGLGPASMLHPFTTKEDVPSTGPLNVSVSNVSSTSVLIDWSPPLPYHHNGVIRHYTVTLMEVPTDTVAVFNTSDQFIHLQNLHPYYDYTFDISVVTIGPGPGSNGAFKLLEDVPSSPPPNVTVWPVNSTTLAVSWDDIEEHDKNGVIRFYRMIISDSQDSSFSLELLVCNSTTAIITNLKPYHTYTVEIAGHTIVTGPYSDTVNTTLPQAAPSEPPSELVAILEQNLTTHISWASPSVDAINGVLLGYRINCTALNEHQLTDDVSGTSVSVHGLQPNTHYTCSVCAYTVIGCGPSELVYISTYEGSLVGPPSLLSVTTVSATEVTIQWTPPFDPDGVILNYVITYQLINTSFTIETPRPPVAINSTNTSFTIESLLTNSNYRIMVFAVYDEGTGPVSEPISMTTLAEDEFSVRNYRCLSESSESMKCSWNHPVSVDEYYLSEYQLSYRLADGWDYYPGYGTELGKVSLSPMTTEYTITGLRPYGGYIIELISVLSYNNIIGSGDKAMDDGIRSISSVFITTEPEIPRGTVEDLKVESNNASSADISFRPPLRVNWCGIIESYSIVAVRGSSNDTAGDSPREVTMVTPQVNHPDPSLATEPLQIERYRLNNLEENFEYQFSVIVINSEGAGISSTPIAQIMPESVPSGGAIDIAAVNMTKSEMTVTWKPPNPLEANGVVQMYSLNLTRVSIRDTLIKQFPMDQLSYRQQGLQTYETISVSVAAMTSVGWGPYSNVTYFNTLEDLPGSPVDLKEELLNTSTVILTWGTPNNPNGVITSYQIIYSGHQISQSSVSEGPLERSVDAVTDGSLNTITITDLTQGYLYEFKVRGKNGAGYGENSTVAVLIPSDDVFDGCSSQGSGVTGAAVGTSITSTIIIIIIIVVILVVCLAFVLKKKRHQRKERLYDEPEPQETPLEILKIGTGTVTINSSTLETEDNNYENMSFHPVDDYKGDQGLHHVTTNHKCTEENEWESSYKFKQSNGKMSEQGSRITEGKKFGTSI